MGCIEKLLWFSTFIKNIFLETTIEPVAFLFYLGLRTSDSFATSSLKLDRFCRINLGHTAEECDHMKDWHHNGTLVEVQKLVSSFNFHVRVIETVIPVCIMLLVASWTDRRGRKSCMLLSYSGYILFKFVYLLVAIFPSLPPEVLYAASIVKTIGGSWYVFFVCCYSYITDITKDKNRTVRIIILGASFELGDFIGIKIGKKFYHTLGPIGAFSFSIAIYAIGVIYMIIVVKNKVHAPSSEDEVKRYEYPRCLRNIFYNVVDLLQTIFKNRPKNGRIHLIFCMTFMMAILSSYIHQPQLWTRRVFDWTSVDYNLYKTVKYALQPVMMIATAAAIHKFDINDCSVGAASALLISVKGLVFGVIDSKTLHWVPYVLTVIPMDLPSQIIRSVLSKMAGPQEVGRVFAMLGILQAVWQVADQAIFTPEYRKTGPYFPSYFHLFAAGFAFYTFIGFIILKIFMKKEDEVKIPQQENYVLLSVENTTAA